MTSLRSAAPRLAPAAGEGAPEEPRTGPSRALDQVYVYPGQLYASDRPCAISTILGTCVSVCLWDPTSRIGGLNHYLLPFPAAERDTSPRFGSTAIDQLLEKVLALGAKRRALAAKVFGGMTSLFAVSAGRPDLGAGNVALALERLEAERIPVLARDVGGERGRKLVFHLDDGSVWVRTL